MKKLQLKLADWLLRRLGYQYVAIKQIPISNVRTYVFGEEVLRHSAYSETPTLFIEGDRELLKYIDTVGYLTKKDPIRRVYDTPEYPALIQKLPAEVVAEITLSTEPFPEELQKQNEIID